MATVISRVVLELLLRNGIALLRGIILLGLNTEVAHLYWGVFVSEAREATLHDRIRVHHRVVCATSSNALEDEDIEEESE